MSLLFNAEKITISTEPDVVALDVCDPITGITCRAVCTPDHALKIAAQLMAAAE
jgi:hypothetical protein